MEEIAARFQIKTQTVVQNLYRFHQIGGSLEAERVLAQSKLQSSEQARVFEAFQRLGIERLAPVYEELGGSVSYEELHLLRLYLSCKKPN